MKRKAQNARFESVNLADVDRAVNWMEETNKPHNLEQPVKKCRLISNFKFLNLCRETDFFCSEGG